MDILSKERRSWNMSRIRSKDTKPECVVRSTLHRMGYRFRLHRMDLPGNPDIVLPKFKTVVFVHGCFWHRHKYCKYAYEPKSKRRFWLKKFDETISRDQRNRKKLKKLGWTHVVIWECELENLVKMQKKLERVLSREGMS